MVRERYANGVGLLEAYFSLCCLSAMSDHRVGTGQHGLNSVTRLGSCVRSSHCRLRFIPIGSAVCSMHWSTMGRITGPRLLFWSLRGRLLCFGFNRRVTGGIIAASMKLHGGFLVRLEEIGVVEADGPVSDQLPDFRRRGSDRRQRAGSSLFYSPKLTCEWQCRLAE